MTFTSASIEANTISEAWVKAQAASLTRGVDFLAPLMVQIDRLDDQPIDDERVHKLLDEELAAVRRSNEAKRKSVARNKTPKPFGIETTANTIFPVYLYDRLGRDPQKLYTRYEELFYRRLKRHNPYGTYFMRLIQYGADYKQRNAGKNQLKDLVDCYKNGGKKGIHRASLLQGGVLDPLRDLICQPQRGFPCLQQVALTPHDGELAVSAFYATQLVFERAYGNYLGLWNLGEFIAEQLDLRLTRLTCIAAKAKAHDSGPTHKQIRDLLKKI